MNLQCTEQVQPRSDLLQNFLLAFDAIVAILCAGGAMPTRNVSLPKALDLFVNRTIKTGRYDNASEVVRAGLRLLVQEEKENAEKYIECVEDKASEKKYYLQEEEIEDTDEDGK